ncbi:hypothetical protein SJZ69_15500 [Acinetobacter baumannii]|nr:hypothetical protein [Acinetobacter baumannii]
MSIINKEILDSLLVAVQDESLNKFEIYCSFLSGSKTEGLATPKSDYDIYIVVNILPEGINHNELFLPYKDGLIEVTLLRKSYILDGFKRLIDNNADLISQISLYEALLYHRILIGIPIVNKINYCSLKEKVPINELKFFLSHYSFNFSRKCFNDCIGNIEANDLDTAIYNADRAVHSAIDVLIVNHGSTSNSVKWRSRYIKKFLGLDHPMFIRYKELTSSLPLMVSSPEKLRYIERVGYFIHVVNEFYCMKQVFKNINYEFSEERIWGVSPINLNMNKRIVKKGLIKVDYNKNKIIISDFYKYYTLSKEAFAVWYSINNENSKNDIINEVARILEKEYDECYSIVEESLRFFYSNGFLYDY